MTDIPLSQEQSESEIVERRSTPYTRQIVLGLTAALIIAPLAYYTPFLARAGVAAFFVIMAILIYLLVVVGFLYREGPQKLPFITFIIPTVMVTVGILADIGATLQVTPTLAEEANPVARTLLTSGFSVASVYISGALAQLLIFSLYTLLWAAFLRHVQIILALCKRANPKNVFELLKAATGGQHLTWRQYFLPYHLSELPKSYPLVWFVAVAYPGYGLFRLFLGLQWLGLAAGLLPVVVITVLNVISWLVYLGWLWSRCKAAR